jgi:AraC family transcriptional activator of pobA
MPRKTQPIPVNHFGDDSGAGISIERFTFENLPDLGEWEQPERHDRHSFFLIETGRVTLEIDFERHHIQSPAIVYMHPDQVHRIIGFEHVTACALAITDEALKPEYLRILEEMSPIAPVQLGSETFGLLSQATSLCLKIAERGKDQLYSTLLKDHGNALAGLIISASIAQANPVEKFSRSEQITKAFREALAQHFAHLKRPADYARKLNLTAAYLNECVKITTGQPVSFHIQNRIVLEAKRLIYYSDQSLKEIAARLGYTDYPYFSRLFTKLAGLSPLNFRNKNRD